MPSKGMEMLDTLVSVGDTSKFLDLWVVDRSGMAFLKRVRRRLAGYTAAEEVNGEYYFGTDFTSRPNFIVALGSGEKFFFPDKAHKLRADIFHGFFNRYIAAISKDLEALTGRRKRLRLRHSHPAVRLL